MINYDQMCTILIFNKIKAKKQNLCKNLEYLILKYKNKSDLVLNKLYEI